MVWYFYNELQWSVNWNFKLSHSVHIFIVVHHTVHFCQDCWTSREENTKNTGFLKLNWHIYSEKVGVICSSLSYNLYSFFFDIYSFVAHPNRESSLFQILISTVLFKRCFCIYFHVEELEFSEFLCLYGVELIYTFNLNTSSCELMSY